MNDVLLSYVNNLPYYEPTISIGAFSGMALLMKRFPLLATKLENNKYKSSLKFLIVVLIGVCMGYIYHDQNMVGFADINTALITGAVSAAIAAGLRDAVKNIAQPKIVVNNSNPIPH